jgi:hypothetical protein
MHWLDGGGPPVGDWHVLGQSQGGSLVCMLVVGTLSESISSFGDPGLQLLPKQVLLSLGVSTGRV